ncbi:MAG: aconitase X catalytic domain-containing protein [Candidatus Bathyarchaeia archaeon]
MFLTRAEESVLKGEQGQTLAKAMRLLVTLGDLSGAPRLVPIKRSQVAGVSYKTAGEPTLELLENLAAESVKARTLATQNPAGMDLERWRDMGISRNFAEKQLRICLAYEKLGIKSTCTCTPYLSGNKPSFGETVGFSESSAVVYANSILGARTNRHGGLDALSAALVGKVPLMGYLIEENRLPDVLVKVSFKPDSEADYGAIGYYVGKRLTMDEVPYFEGIEHASYDELKLMGAACASSGATALFHVQGRTPETYGGRLRYKHGKPTDTLTINKEDIVDVYDELSSPTTCDLIAIGCPHCSLREVKWASQLLAHREVKKGTRLWIFTSPRVYSEAARRGYVQTIQASGANIFRHTCIVVMPVEELDVTGVATNSAKAAFYIPRTTQNRCQARLLSLEECIKLATGF